MESKSFGRTKLWAKWLLFPGFDLHTRCRYRFLPRFFRPGPIATLDAGCGNGALSYAAYKLGNRVLGVTNDPDEVRKAEALFSEAGAESYRFSFVVCNLYDLQAIGQKFDQIICSEALEHISGDQKVIRSFYQVLNEGGVLHLCCPYALHPDHRLGRIDGPEDGGHVRDGYTAESYRALLEPAGFEIIRTVGLGTPLLVAMDKIVRYVRNKHGDIFAAPLFLVTWPFQWLDCLNPALPFSLYVQAVKRSRTDPSV